MAAAALIGYAADRGCSHAVAAAGQCAYRYAFANGTSRRAAYGSQWFRLFLLAFLLDDAALAGEALWSFACELLLCCLFYWYAGMLRASGVAAFSAKLLRRALVPFTRPSSRPSRERERYADANCCVY